MASGNRSSNWGSIGERSASHGVTRRQLVTRLAAAGFTAPVIGSILASGAWAQDDATPEAHALIDEFGKHPDMIPHGSTNLETPLEHVENFLVPNDLFFIRSNGPTPEISADEWRLRVHGLVDEELELSLDDLRELSERTITAFLECSGNSRGRFETRADGSQWTNGAIGNAEWTGVSLVEVLDMAGVQEDAVDIVSQGGDFDDMQRGLPLNVARDPDTMLVWEMNGEDLPREHGGPVRLFVPRWGGIASTKWIVGVEVIDHVFDGHFNTESYVFIDEHGQVIRPVREMPVKSVITSPAANSEVSEGEQTISGFAWSGYGAIREIEVSTDGGESWNEAEITDEAGRLSWVRFEYQWDAASGDARLRSRAVDELGMQQPESAEWNALGYQNNSIFEVFVTVN